MTGQQQPHPHTIQPTGNGDQPAVALTRTHAIEPFSTGPIQHFLFKALSDWGLSLVCPFCDGALHDLEEDDYLEVLVHKAFDHICPSVSAESAGAVTTQQAVTVLLSTHDAEQMTGRWVRITRDVNPGEQATHLVLVLRAWATGTHPNSIGLYPVDGSFGLAAFEPNTPVPYTSMHVPANASYEVLPGCADVPISKPHARRELLDATVCPSGQACTCVARWSRH